jgi:hypothetical protein
VIDGEDSQTQVLELKAGSAQWTVTTGLGDFYTNVYELDHGGTTWAAAGSFIGPDRGDGEYSDVRAAAWIADGTGAWQRFTLGGTSAWARDLARGPAGYVVAGEVDIWDRGDAGTCAAPAIWTSSAGTKWSKPRVLGNDTCASMHAVAATDSRIVAVGTSIWTSTDATAWHEAEVLDTSDFVPTTFLNGVATDGQSFVAVGTACTDACQAIIWTSTDGANWQQSDVPASTGAYRGAVVWLGDRYYAIWDRGSTLESADGITWTEADHAPATDRGLYRLTEMRGAPVVASVTDGRVWLWTGD